MELTAAAGGTVAFDLATAVELRARANRKWDLPFADGFGARPAETDFGTAPAVVDALRSAVADMDFAYLPPRLVAGLREACAGWQCRRYGWTVDPEDIHPLPDVLRGIELAITRFSPPGTAVMVPTPAYPGFLAVPRSLGRPVIEVPMVADGSRWVLDLDALGGAFRAGGHLVVLCNPHNPTGRVLDRDELASLAAVVDHHGGRVVADEVHAPVTYPGYRHVPYAAVGEVAAGHSLTITSASKGWNLAGLKCAQLILTSAADRAAWRGIVEGEPMRASNLGVVANTAAYAGGAGWLDELVAYLDGSRAELAALVAGALPGVGFSPPEGTYLAWIDFRPVGIARPGARFAVESSVLLLEGRACGEAGRGFARLNFATPRPVLRAMLQRLAPTHADQLRRRR